LSTTAKIFPMNKIIHQMYYVNITSPLLLKQDDQTYVEFSREKELLFEKWLTSKEVTKFFLNKLKAKIM
jgi:hypothetical protein